MEHLRDAALQQQRERFPVFLPQRVRHPVRLHGLEALEEEQDLQVLVARGVAVHHRLQVRLRAPHERRVFPVLRAEQLEELRIEQHVASQLVRQHERQRVFQRAVREDGGEQVTRQRGLGLRVLARFLTQRLPNRHAVDGTRLPNHRGSVGGGDVLRRGDPRLGLAKSVGDRASRNAARRASRSSFRRGAGRHGRRRQSRRSRHFVAQSKSPSEPPCHQISVPGPTLGRLAERGRYVRRGEARRSSPG